MTTKKFRRYTLFSSLFLATVFATNTAFAEDVANNDQANQPNPSQEQAAPATENQANAGNQAGAQDAQNGNDAAANQEAAVTDPTVTEISKQDNGDGTSTVTSEVTSQDLEKAKEDVSTFNQENKDVVNPAVTLVKGETQEQASVEAAHADNQAQAKDIEAALSSQKAKIDQYKTELAKYEESLAQKPELEKKYQEALLKYEEDMKEYKAAKVAYDEYQKLIAQGVDAGRIEKAQGLIYQNEPNASISLEGVSQYLTNEAVAKHHTDGILDQFNTDKYQTDGHYNADEFTDQNPTNGKEDVWFRIQVGQTVTATYTGLENSYYDGKKLSKVIINYRLNSTTNNDNDALVKLFHDPTKTIFIGAQTSKEGRGDKISITIHPIFFDLDGNQVDLSNNKAIMGLSSLNHWITEYGDHVEKVEVGDNEYIQIPGSSVQNHNGAAYSEKDNQYKSHGAVFNGDGEDGWDSINDDGTPRSKTAFYGAGAMTYKGQPFTVTAGGNDQFLPTTIWFSANSVVSVPKDPGQAPEKPQPAENPKKPLAPTTMTVTWHENIVKEVKIPIKPVIPQTTTTVERPKPQPKPQTPTTPIPVKMVEPKPAPVQKQATLPQTGDSNGYGLVAFGAGIVLYATLTLLGSRKMDQNED